MQDRALTALQNLLAELPPKAWVAGQGAGQEAGQGEGPGKRYGVMWAFLHNLLTDDEGEKKVNSDAVVGAMLSLSERLKSVKFDVSALIGCFN